MDFKKAKMETSLKVLKKRKIELLNKGFFSQNEADKIVRKIANEIFKYQVIKERIARPYIIDIYIKNIRVGIEIDGGIHNTQCSYDNERDKYLWEVHNIAIYRFDNHKVKKPEFKKAIWAICCQGVYQYLSYLRRKAKIHKMDLPHNFPIIGDDNLKFKGNFISETIYEDMGFLVDIERSSDWIET